MSDQCREAASYELRASNTVDYTPGIKADFLFAGDGGMLFGATLGAGFSTDLNKWAIRPEIGMLSIGGVGGFVSYGVALQVIMSKGHNKRGR